MKAREQKASKGSKSGVQALSLEKQTGATDSVHKDNNSEERRVTRSMRKTGEKVTFDHFNDNPQIQSDPVTTDIGVSQTHTQVEGMTPIIQEPNSAVITDSKTTIGSSDQVISQNLFKRKNKKVLRKSKRGRSKNKSKYRLETSSVGKYGDQNYSIVRTFDNKSGKDTNSFNELDMDITSVTFIHENSSSTPSPAGGTSRMAKISWSRFDSFFRKIPMGTRKDIILKTIPTNPVLRRPIIQELTTLEQTLFTDPPWGKIGRASPYINKSNLSLPPIYMKSCSLDAIVDLVSKSILKSRGGNHSKMPQEIQKPYFLLFELPRSLSLVALEPKSSLELGIPETNHFEDHTIQDTHMTLINTFPEIDSTNNTVHILPNHKSQDLCHPPIIDQLDLKPCVPDILENFNIKWDILQTLDLSYYQFKYIERYLHDVFFNYDQSHKKVFFTPARINHQQNDYTINIFEKISNNLEELNSLVNFNISNQTPIQQEEKNFDNLLFNETPNTIGNIDLRNLINEFNKVNSPSETVSFDQVNSNIDTNGTANVTHPTSGPSISIQAQLPSSDTPSYREDKWGTYRSYDPIYWWVDFVLPSIAPCSSLDSHNDTLQDPYSQDHKVFLHKNGLSFVNAPNCVKLGGLYWLDPSKPLKLTREIKDKHRFNIDTQSSKEENSHEETQQLVPEDNPTGKEEFEQESDTLFIHPYMMNDFIDNKDFNFVEANLERFLPIYNEIVDSIANHRLKIQNRIIYENENNVRITDIPFIWMNVVQRYQIVNSWNKLKFFLTNGYKDLYPAFLRQADASKKMESAQSIDLESKPKDEKKSKFSKFDEMLESKEKNIHLTKVCSVCFNWETDTLKPFVECVRCGVVSHVACYGVNIPLNELLDFYGWLCDRCEFEKKFLGTQYLIAFNPGSISCVLCSHSGGALKRTNKEGLWVHLVCAIWHLPLVTCEDWKNLSNWNVDRVKRSWTNKKIGKENNPNHVRNIVEKAEITNSSLNSPIAQSVPDFGQRSTSSIVSGHSEISALKLETSISENCRIESEKSDFVFDQNQSVSQESIVSYSIGQEFPQALDHRNSEDNSLRCIFCKNDNTFGLVGCDHKDCEELFHPICAWLNGIQIEVDCDPCYSKGETLVGYIQGWRNVQDEALQLVNIRCFCLSHIKNKGITNRELSEEINLRKKRYINRDMFPDLFNSKYNQKSNRNSQLGVIQRSRTRSVSRSKSWDVTSPNSVKKNSCEIFKQNQVHYYNALNPDKYDKDICCICLKYDSTDFPSKGGGSFDSNKDLMQIPNSGESCPNSNSSIMFMEKLKNEDLKDREEEITLASNLLIRCICCGLTVHWNCYGLGEKMETMEDFVCQACNKGVRPENTSCILCPRRGGALIEAQGIPQSFGGRPGEKAQFVHVTCALYTPGIYILACGQAYGAANYLGMTSLVKLQKDGTISKSKGTFVRRFGGIEGSVQQLPFRDIRNEEQFILDQFTDQDTLEVPNVYCCICKSSYGVNLACNHPGCMRTAHPLCMKLYGCYMETIAEIEEPRQEQEILLESQKLHVNNSTRGGSNVLYVSPNCQPPNLDVNAIRFPEVRENYFSQKVFCPEHGKQMGNLNPGGKLLNSTLSSLKIVGKILEDLLHSERLKRQLFNTQLDIMNKENPIFSPLMMGNTNALRIYWDYYSKGILQESVKIRNGTINKFKDNSKNGILLKPSISQGDMNLIGGNKSPKKYQQQNSILQCNQVGQLSSNIPVKAAGLKRTRSSGEATEVPSLEDAIKEARKQREIYKRELAASGIVIKSRPPPNRSPTIPFSRLTDAELKDCALNCLNTIGSSSKLAMSLITNFNNNNGNQPQNNQTTPIDNNSQLQQNSNSSQSPLPVSAPTIRSFCIKQHRHDCFRRRLAEFIIYPPAVMDHRRKTLRSLTRQLKQYGVTAEELMASDVPLPPIKSKPPPNLQTVQGITSNINNSNTSSCLAMNSVITANTTVTTITNTNANNTSTTDFSSMINNSINNNPELGAQTVITPSSNITCFNNSNNNVNTNITSTSTNSPEHVLNHEKSLQNNNC